MTRRPGQDWSARNWSERLSKGEQSKAQRVRTLLEGARDRALDSVATVDRSGSSSSTMIRYATTAAPNDWSPLSAGLPAIAALLDSVIDGRDRVLLAWPERPGNGFTLSALALRQARATGKLASATLAVWPWRSGLMRAARSALVHPKDIADAARTAINELESGASWTNDGLAHRALDMVELRLNDLMMKNAPARVTRGRPRLDIVVRSPTLLETTAVFVPFRGTYTPDPDQVLRRVRDHTFLGDAGAAMIASRRAVGDPADTPFALLGLPAERTVARMERYLAHSRIRERGLDAVVVDLTRSSRAELGDNWDQAFGRLLETLDSMDGRRPPVIVLCEDPFTMKTAGRAMRSHNARLKPRRHAPADEGIYLPEAGFLASGDALPSELLPIEFTADIKDAFLAVLREKLVGMGKHFREQGNVEGARATSGALSFLRRIASLPLGVAEARGTADVLFDSDDDVDAGNRAMFRPMMALAALVKSGAASSEGAAATDVVKRIEELAQLWAAETPVSAKLRALLANDGWNSQRTLIAVPERRIAEVLLASDRAVHWSCPIIDHAGLAIALDKSALDRVIVVGPTSTALRALLTSEGAPTKAVLVGDASGSALLAGELAPLSRLPGFEFVAQRASSLLAALKRGGLDERLGVGESEFRVLPIAQSQDIDLTREGGDYGGDRVVLHTAGHRITYRPMSDVLIFTSGEARPFERMHARDVEKGDQVLVLDEKTRERIRQAVATSRKSLEQLTAYHEHVGSLRQSLPGDTLAEKSREALRRMRVIDPSVPDSETANVTRWLTADTAPVPHDGARQPRAARDWNRFWLFMQANDVSEFLAQTYWKLAIVPTRSYRVQEGFQFNQRVVQFILDPESFGSGRPVDASLRELWLSLLDAIDDVQEVELVKGESGK